jgi:hypothetical protein
VTVLTPALAASRSTTNPAQRARLLARSGELLNLLSRPGGNALLREAGALAAQIGVERGEADARVAVATRVSLLDLDKARGILSALKDDQTKKWAMGEVGKRQKSLAWLARRNLKAAHGTALKEPQEHRRAISLWWLARQAAPRDTRFAAQLLREAAELAAQEPEHEWYDVETRAAVLARCAGLARKLKLPEAPQWALRALEVRGTFAEYSSDARQGFEAHDVLLTLALTESYPALAREWFSVARPRLLQGKFETGHLASLLLPAAAAPFDPPLADAEIKRVSREHLVFTTEHVAALLVGGRPRREMLDEFSFSFLPDNER